MPLSGTGVEKRPFPHFSRLWGVIWREKAFRDQQCQFLTRNKSLSSENESNLKNHHTSSAHALTESPYSLLLSLHQTSGGVCLHSMAQALSSPT